MVQYYFYAHGEEFRIGLKISTGKYKIFNSELDLVYSQ